MIYISILGCDSSHTEAFTQLINPPDSPFYPRAKVVSIWGEDVEQAQIKAQSLGIERVESQIEEALQNCDFAMVLGRYADSHFLQARAAIHKKVPLFVDKVLCQTIDESKALVSLAQQNAVPMQSFSALRFSPEIQTLKSSVAQGHFPEYISIGGPGSVSSLQDERAKQINFYGIHLVDIALELLGEGFTFQSQIQNEMGLSVSLLHQSGCHVNLFFSFVSGELYHYSLRSQDAYFSGQIDAWGPFYENGLRYLLDWIESGFSNENQIPIQQSLEACALLDQIEKLCSSKIK